MFVLLLASLTGAITSLARPSFTIQTSGETTEYRVAPASIERSAILLAVSVVSATALLLREIPRRLKKLAGSALVVALASTVPLWHHAVCRVTVTPETFTAPLRGGLFPGQLTVLRFADLADIFFQGERTGSRYQICRTRKNVRIELDCGPLSTILSGDIETPARAHQVRVFHSF
jgi:hypothetical protein